MQNCFSTMGRKHVRVKVHGQNQKTGNNDNQHKQCSKPKEIDYI